jgi:hypothetical protein
VEGSMSKVCFIKQHRDRKRIGYKGDVIKLTPRRGKFVGKEDTLQSSRILLSSFLLPSYTHNRKKELDIKMAWQEYVCMKNG